MSNLFLFYFYYSHLKPLHYFQILILLYFFPGNRTISCFHCSFLQLFPFYLFLYFLIFILFSEQFDMLSQVLIMLLLFLCSVWYNKNLIKFTWTQRFGPLKNFLFRFYAKQLHSYWSNFITGESTRRSRRDLHSKSVRFGRRREWLEVC